MRHHIHPHTTFDAPSGQRLDDRDLMLIRSLAENGSIAWSDKEVTFNSGFKSHVYVRMRTDLTHNIPLLSDVGERIKNFVLKLRPTHGPKHCFIGVPTAGTPLALAAAMVSGGQICFRQMRSELKEGHGKSEDSMWVGPPELEGFSPTTVENVVSTAKAYFKHLGRLEEDGYPTKEMRHIAFADWELGGVEALHDAGYKNGFVIYRVRDMIAALVYLNDWPGEQYDETNRRVNAWRKEKKLKRAA